MDNLVSVKVKTGAGFTGEYYVGELTHRTDKEYTITNPVRFVEVMTPRQVPSKALDANGNPQQDTVIVPQTQSIEEAGISLDKATIPNESIILVSEITEASNKGLWTAYNDALKLRRANRAGLHLAGEKTTEVRQ